MERVSLTAGSSLGPYEIVSLLGAGGMGEVYRARDQRLDRIVAIKVLPTALSANPDLRQRLEREARTISALTHPHVCMLFDVGRTPDGASFLVMEYLEGESLAERLSRGGLPVKQALRFGAEIAEALDAAHRQGVVHRDLKPGNVMITKSGVKLLDFGLAKLIAPDGLVSDPNSPTLQQQYDVTAAGTIVGTLQYMSPEQLEGKPADARSDIFALGATLYEMLTGQRAFQASSRAALIARILSADPPPPSAIEPGIPPNIVHLIQHCLMKDPDERWQTARDVAIQLRGAAEGSSTEYAVPSAKGRRDRWRLAAMAAIAVAAAATVFALWQGLGRDTPTTAPQFSRVSIALAPNGERLTLHEAGALAIAPDGSRIVFTGNDGKTSRLYVRRTDSFALTPLPGSEEPWSAFFSPDGKQIAFNSKGRLRRFDFGSGVTEILAETLGPGGYGSWDADGTIYFNVSPTATIHRVPATGGAAVPLQPKGGEGLLFLPHVVRGRDLMFCVREIEGRSLDEADILAVSLKRNEAKVVARGTSPRYVAAKDRLLFAREGKIWSIAFDPEAIEARGTPTPLVDQVLTYPGGAVAMYDVTDAGDIVYAPYSAEIWNTRVMLAGRDGKARPIPFPPAIYASPHLTADGRKLILEVVNANNDVWIGDMERATLNRVTSRWENLAPVLSPDGQQVIVSRFHDSLPKLHLIRTDGVGEPRPVAPSTQARFAHSWSGDGRVVAFTEFGSERSDVHVLRMDSTYEVVPLLTSRFSEKSPALSPDGRWIAYNSNETGRQEIYVRSIEDAGTKTRVSTDGGFEPLWSNSGRELYYRRGASLMAVNVTFEPAFSVSHPVRLFDFSAVIRDESPSYDVTPEGNFIFIEWPERAGNLKTLNIVRGAVR